jgi:hypothetical protein
LRAGSYDGVAQRLAVAGCDRESHSRLSRLSRDLDAATGQFSWTGG